MERSRNEPGKARKKNVVVATFVHTFRWGQQIRGDERGFLEKVKRYKALGIDFFALERDPSLQDGMGWHVYGSLKLGNCRVPPQNVVQLFVLSLFALRAGLRRYPARPLAIYAYNQDIENLWAAYILKVLIGSPFVVVYHQIRPAAFASLREGIADRMERGFHPFSAVYNSLLPALNRYAASHAEVHVALSAATKSDVERYLGVEDCAVVGNGLDTTKFLPLNLTKTYDAVFLGRLAHQKGIDLLLEAWSRVVLEMPGATLILLGGGEPEDVARYKAMAKDLHLEKNVTFAGFVDDQELVRVLNSSKLFVFPSRKEGFAQAVSQAMGCGLACVLSDIPPLREVYGTAAVYFPVDQPTPLAERILQLLGSEDDRERYGAMALQLAHSLSWDNTVKGELMELLKQTRNTP